ncbi:hypothetical protein PSPTOT1_0781 [Pseudomonas syringae pv. tomato T1]|nr:hypothetical protein PSPTOT1_0781 [Pseudomonas syringae pv. tomato T1]
MDSDILPNPRNHWVLRKVNITVHKGNIIAFISLQYRYFPKTLRALIYKGCSRFQQRILLISLFFFAPTNFETLPLGGLLGEVRTCVGVCAFTGASNHV